MKTIRDLRQERDWTQYELAIKVGVHPQAVYFWESGRRMPQVPQLRKLGQLFGLCSDEIVLVDTPANGHGAASRSRRRSSPADLPEHGSTTNTDDETVSR